MRDVRKRNLDSAVWIPLRSSHEDSTGRFGFAGYTSEFVGLGSIAIPLDKRVSAETLRWEHIGLRREHQPFFQDGHYIPADEFTGNEPGLSGIALVLAQRGNRAEPTEWHLHQDFVIALRLIREGDIWLAMDEGYVQAARLHKTPTGTPSLLEVRAEYLKEYLCARNLALYVSSYRSREEVMEDPSDTVSVDNPIREIEGRDRWEGRVIEIHEGGYPFGSSAAVLHVGRQDVDLAEDVPTIGPDDENIVSRSWTIEREGRKLYRVLGELWRNEWVNAAKQSPRIRGDKVASGVSFIIDASGTRETSAVLEDSGRWLWFQPGVIVVLAHRRGGALEWDTRDTGAVECSPGCRVSFGVNALGMVNVYARDVTLLPEWQQRLWAGFNVGPEGGVSEELLASQAEGMPADTHAPEALLPPAIELLNDIAKERFGFALFRDHDQAPGILSHTHRFRATDEAGFFSLAKDLARLTADRIDGSSIQKIAASPDGKKCGSLKSLEHLVAREIGPIEARALLGPLFGAYELRHADAHLAGSGLEEFYKLVRVDQTSPSVPRGYQLLHSCVTCLYEIANALRPSRLKDT
jgi:hypothetical protein